MVLPLSSVVKVRIDGSGIRTPDSIVISGSTETIHSYIRKQFADGSVGGYWNLQDPSSRLDNGLIPDLSGQSNAWVQTTPSQKAQFIQDANGCWSLKFDGVDDSYVTRSIDFSKTDKVTVICAMNRLGNSERGLAYEHGNNVSNGFRLFSPDTSGALNVRTYVGGTTNTISNVLNNTKAISTFKADKTNNMHTLKFNNKVGTLSGTLMGLGNFENYPLYIGRRGGTSLPFNGQIYALLVIGKLLDDATTAKIEKEFAKYIGVTL